MWCDCSSGPITVAPFLPPRCLAHRFLVACDIAARTIAAPEEVPVGVLTALIGGPFFLWLMRRKAMT